MNGPTDQKPVARAAEGDDLDKDFQLHETQHMSLEFTAEQQLRNRMSQSGWTRYSAHRQRLTRIVQRAGQSGLGRELCVLGAGNVNDLDLSELLATDWSIQLVDLDGEALATGVAQQQVQDDPGLLCHGNVDVTGCLEVLTTLSPQSEVEHVRDVAAQLVNSRPTYEVPMGDVVLSTGLLSQLVEIAALTIGQEHAGFVELVQALRLQHLRMLVELTRPRGTVIVTTEVVSTSTAPHLATLTDDELPSALSMLLLQGNFFSGLHPGIIGATLQQDVMLKEQLCEIRVEAPWLWDFMTRTYAVCAFVGRRSE